MADATEFSQDQFNALAADPALGEIGTDDLLTGTAPSPGLAGVVAPPAASQVNAASFVPLTPNGDGGDTSGIDLLLDVQLQISVELGRARMTIGDVLGLRAGSVIELDKLAGEAADILVNGTLIARGEVVVVDDKFGVRVIEVVPRKQRLESLA